MAGRMIRIIKTSRTSLLPCARLQGDGPKAELCLANERPDVWGRSESSLRIVENEVTDFEWNGAVRALCWAGPAYVRMLIKLLRVVVHGGRKKIGFGVRITDE